MTFTYDILLHYLNWQAKSTATKIIKELNLSNKSLIVDIGAGGGFFSYAFSENNSDSRIIAIDVDQRQLDFIKRQSIKKNIKNIETLLVNPDSSTLPLKEHSVDLFFMRNMFHDLSNPHTYFVELKRKLNKSGRIAIVEFLPNLKFLEGRMGHCTEESLIEKIMASAGFSIQSTYDFLKPRQSFSIYELSNNT